MSDSIDFSEVRAARGHESARRGQIAEDWAKALIDRHFERAFSPHRDTGTDFLAVYSLPAQSAVVNFSFQVKHGSSFPVTRRTVLRWMETMESTSTILVHVDGNTQPTFQFLVLHDWALSHPDWPTILTRATGKKYNFKLREFVEVDQAERNFAAAIETESRRALGLTGALFHVNPLRKLALSEAELFREFGHLHDFELPVRIREYLADFPDVYGDYRSLIRELRSAPTSAVPLDLPTPARPWMSSLSRAPSTDDAARERAQFVNFVNSMRALDSDQARLFMPNYRWLDLSSWRVFMEMYPNSFRLLEVMFRHLDRWSSNELCAGMLLLSGLANTDSISAGKAATLLRSLDFHSANGIPTRDMDRYQVTRAYKFSLAEARIGARPVADFLDFTRRNYQSDDLNREALLNLRYYRGRITNLSDMRELTLSKMRNARPRDENARPILEALVETFWR